MLHSTTIDFWNFHIITKWQQLSKNFFYVKGTRATNHYISLTQNISYHTIIFRLFPLNFLTRCVFISLPGFCLVAPLPQNKNAVRQLENLVFTSTISYLYSYIGKYVHMWIKSSRPLKYILLPSHSTTTPPTPTNMSALAGLKNDFGNDFMSVLSQIFARFTLLPLSLHFLPLIRIHFYVFVYIIIITFSHFTTFSWKKGYRLHLHPYYHHHITINTHFSTFFVPFCVFS